MTNRYVAVGQRPAPNAGQDCDIGAVWQHLRAQPRETTQDMIRMAFVRNSGECLCAAADSVVRAAQSLAAAIRKQTDATMLLAHSRDAGATEAARLMSEIDVHQAAAAKHQADATRFRSKAKDYYAIADNIEAIIGAAVRAGVIRLG